MVTVKQLKERIRKHNKKQCIKLSQRKAQLEQALASVSHSAPAPAPAFAPAPAQKPKKKKKKRIAPMLISASVGGGSSSMGGGGGGGGGGTKGQKYFKGKLKKQKKAYKLAQGYDTNPELAF